MCTGLLADQFGMGGDQGTDEDQVEDLAITERRKTVTKPEELPLGSGLAGGAQVDISSHAERLNKRMLEAGG